MESNLLAFYKAEINRRSLEIRTFKRSVRALQSLHSRGLNDTPEAMKLRSSLPPIYGQGALLSDRENMRKLYLAYAVVRGMNLSKIEREPPPPEFYASKVKQMEESFRAQSKDFTHG